ALSHTRRAPVSERRESYSSGLSVRIVSRSFGVCGTERGLRCFNRTSLPTSSISFAPTPAPSNACGTTESCKFAGLSVSQCSWFDYFLWNMDHERFPMYAREEAREYIDEMVGNTSGSSL
ncbi:hypothetical protein GBAR_LOCUS30525, partial [Geodia barretti]